MRLRYVEEPEPLGTAGALKFAERLLDERFLMLNGDVLTDIDLTAPDRPARAHRRAGDARAGARSTTRAPTGWCTCNEDRSVQGVRREARARPDRHEPDQRRRLRARARGARAGAAGRNVSIEREVWPQLVGDGLYGFPADGYWLDIGTPERYLQGTFDIIEGNVETAVRARLGESWLAVADGARDPRPGGPAGGDRARRARRAGRARRQPGGARRGRAVGAGTTVERSVMLGGAEIGAGCTLRDCIVARRLSRSAHARRIDGGAVLGEGVTVGADNMIARGARIFPGVTLPDGAIKF